MMEYLLMGARSSASRGVATQVTTRGAWAPHATRAVHGPVGAMLSEVRAVLAAAVRARRRSSAMATAAPASCPASCSCDGA